MSRRLGGSNISANPLLLRMEEMRRSIDMLFRSVGKAISLETHSSYNDISVRFCNTGVGIIYFYHFLKGINNSFDYFLLIGIVLVYSR